MTIQTFNECLSSGIADSAAVGNSTTEAIIIPDYTFPAGYFYQGRTLRVKLWGVISNVVTATPTITLRGRVGATTLSATWVVTTGALTTRATAATNETFTGEFYLVCRSSGTAGTGMITGQFCLPDLTGGTTANVIDVMLPATAPAAGTLNTTIANVLSVSAQWSAANAANTITVNQFVIEALT